MRWRTLNKRRTRQRHGPALPSAALKRIALCNRFAATTAARGLLFSRDWYRTVFYRLKDRLMDRYGKPKGYALQEWTSRAYDGWDDDHGVKDGATHRHILECVKLGRLMLHRPTGHFAYTNEVSEYYKHTLGFDALAAICVEKFNGKKHITRNIPTEREALAALAWLMRRYKALYDLPEKSQPRLRVVTGNSYDDYMNARHRRAREERATAEIECHWCTKKKLGWEMTWIGGHDICLACAEKIAPSMLAATV
jgi:hypothetical protein